MVVNTPELWGNLGKDAKANYFLVVAIAEIQAKKTKEAHSKKHRELSLFPDSSPQAC